MKQFTAYANPEVLQFDDKKLYRQSFSVVLDGVPTRFYRYYTDPLNCLPAGQYTMTTQIQVRNDKLVVKPDFVPVQGK